MPLLSILIANYNHASYIGETLKSILSQDFKSYEILVGDDGSTDQSREVIASFGNAVRSFFFPENRGYFAVIEDLQKEVQGEYVHIFSSDDLYQPGFLSASMELMLRADLKLTCTDIRYFNDDSTRETALYPTSKPLVFGKERIVDVFKKSDFWVPGVSCIVERETFARYGPHNPQLENLCDWYLFHHIALFEGIGYIPRIGVAMREANASYTATVKRDRKRRNATYWRVLDCVKKERSVRIRFRNSALLTFVFDNLFWKLIVRPQWWDFFFYSKSSVIWRVTKSIRKRVHVR